MKFIWQNPVLAVSQLAYFRVFRITRILLPPVSLVKKDLRETVPVWIPRKGNVVGAQPSLSASDDTEKKINKSQILVSFKGLAYLRGEQESPSRELKMGVIDNSRIP
jgi:hypothetical protein